MLKSVLGIVVALLLFAGGGAWWIKGSPAPAPQGQSQPPASPSVAGPTASPNLITVNTPTQVLFTVSIPDPTLNPAGVNLVRINTNGGSTVAAQMVDNGQNGDQQPGDKVFTARLTLTEPQAGELKYQVSAAFRGVLRRSQSPLIAIQVWNSTTTSQGISIKFPPTGSRTMRMAS